MRYIEHIKIQGNSYPTNKLPLDFKFECKDVNLLVGDQGAGKSTLLKLIHGNNKDLEIGLAENCVKNSVDVFYFDTEKDNPRVKDIDCYADSSGKSRGIGLKGAVSTRFQSHGEVMKKFVINPLMEAKDCVILLDEPESGLSIQNQLTLIEAIKAAVINNCQVFIATHCYPLIQEFDVISLDNYTVLEGKDYINSKKQTKNET